MARALVRSTGFVGSNILDAAPFDSVYRSTDIADIRGREFDLVVSAANRADSHRINAAGAADRAEIDGLVDQLATVTIRRLVLISTVCVYPAGGAPDEGTPLSEAGLTPYGANRLHQERRLSELFDTTIVRLPQLHGARMRKGVVHDLLTGHRVEHIDPDGVLQHYDLRRLWGDIERALALGLPALNAATAPLRNADLAREVFGLTLGAPVEPPSTISRMYTRDMRTRHAAAFGESGGYLVDAEAELAGLREFVARADRAAGTARAAVPRA